MVTLTSSFASLALLCSAALAAPQPRPEPQAHTHNVRRTTNGNTVQSYHPESTFETFGVDGVDHPHPLGKRANFRDAGIAFLGSRLGGESKFKVKSSSDADIATHVYVSQSFNDIPVANAVANVAVKGGKVASWASSFVTPKSVAAPTPKISVEDAEAAAESFLDGKRNAIAPKLEYYALDTHAVALTHVVQLELANGHLVEAFVDAETAEVHGIVDFTADLSLNVIPIFKASPLDGFEELVNPEDPLSSPQGWEIFNGAETNVTRGNNAFAFKGTATNFTAESSTNTYDYVWVPSSAPSIGSNVPKAVSNAFYIVNTIHDITYRYGFTESAFNFQQDNFGKGGVGNDPVSVSVQSSAGTNNADFSTPPDGQSGSMRMYRFTITTPNRDGALQNDIVVHEMTHGVTNRMTGGGTGRCLSTTESGGMGEGWSDSMSDWTQQRGPTIVDFTTGDYVLNNTAGVRDFVYTTNTTLNPLTYGTLRTRTEVHSAGVVWATFLHGVHDALVTAHGFADDARTNPDGTSGNQIYLHLFLDALQLQPCNPTVVAARAAWIQADANRYAGANKCLLWSVFAARGVGSGATTTKTDNFAVPAECSATA